MSELPGKLEAAIAALEALSDANARAAAHTVVAAVLELQEDVLTRVCTRLRAVPDGERMLAHLAEDEAVASALLLHGLHPIALDERVRRALAPFDKSRIEVLAIDAAIVRVRVDGNDSLRSAVAAAVREAAPDVDHLEVLAPEPGLVPVARLLGRRGGHERCDLCGVALPAEHEHMVDVEHRRLECACTSCSLLFDAPDAKHRRVRRQVQPLSSFRLDDARWRELGVPVGLAFLFVSSTLGETIAAYPGPAGAVESPVSRAAWKALVADNPVLERLEPDTAALLVDRRGATPVFHLLSIDECFRLTGLVRSRWQGMTGGDGPARALEEFYAGLDGGAR